MSDHKLTIQHINQIVEIRHVITGWETEYVVMGTLEAIVTFGGSQNWRMKGEVEFREAKVVSVRTLQEVEAAWMQP